MRPYKASAVPPFDGLWHGVYYDGRNWNEVRDGNGIAIEYMKPGDAIRAAKDHAERSRPTGRNTQDAQKA